MAVIYSDIDSADCFIETNVGRIMWASGITNSDPLFKDTSFHLSATSPCINAGVESVYVSVWDTVIYAPDYDFEGDSRPAHSDWDIGADEYTGHLTVKNLAENVLREIEIVVRPNPFNSSCVITAPAGARIEIYNLQGQLVYISPSASGGETKREE